MNYPIMVLEAALLALARVNIKDTRIDELKKAIKLLKESSSEKTKIGTLLGD